MSLAQNRSGSSLDLGGKPKVGTVSPFSSSINLTKTIMGTGMLCLPAAFQTMGLVWAFLMLALAAFMSAMGLYLLTCSVERVGGREVDFSALSKATYPRLAPVFDLAILLKCLGVSIGYLVVVGTLMPQLVAGIWAGAPSLLVSPSFWMTVTCLGIAPVIFMPKMDSLKYTSFLGMLSVLYMIILAAALFFAAGQTNANHFEHLRLFQPISKSFIKSFAVFVFSFTCHQNMLPIQNEAKQNSSLAMGRIICVCVGFALALYTSFAVFSYAAFGNIIIPPSNLILACILPFGFILNITPL